MEPQKPPIPKVIKPQRPKRDSPLARKADRMLKFIRDKAEKDAKLAAMSNSVQQVSRYPSPEHQPIPRVIWRLIFYVKRLPKVPATGLPDRSVLCTPFFQRDFDSSTGFLKVESALYRYRGNQKLLNKHWWQFILPPSRLRINEGAMFGM